MGQSCRYVELVVLLIIEIASFPFSERRGRLPQVYDHILDAAGHDGGEFCLAVPCATAGLSGCHCYRSTPQRSAWAASSRCNSTLPACSALALQLAILPFGVWVSGFSSALFVDSRSPNLRSSSCMRTARRGEPRRVTGGMLPMNRDRRRFSCWGRDCAGGKVRYRARLLRARRWARHSHCGAVRHQCTCPRPRSPFVGALAK